MSGSTPWRQRYRHADAGRAGDPGDLRTALVRRTGARASHLVVQPEQVQGLKLGLAHAGLVLEEWQRKMTDLRGALAARGQFPTVDIDHAPSPEEGTEPWKRLLGPTVER